MPYTDSDEVAIYYETTGDPSGEPLVLISGTGGQMIGWRPEFCALLAEAGFFVIRLDNRDTGLSQRFGGVEDLDGGYELSDLALDVLRVLDAVGVERAHLFGHSMGGMVAQILALDHAERVKTMALLGTLPEPRDSWVLHDMPVFEPPVRLSREEAIRLGTQLGRPPRPTPYDWDEAWHAEAAAEAYDRGYTPEGALRQWSAMLRTPDRLARLQEVTVPTLVMHGRDDDALHWSAGVAIAEAIPDAELIVYAHLDHGRPKALWPDFVNALVRLAARAPSDGS